MGCLRCRPSITGCTLLEVSKLAPLFAFANPPLGDVTRMRKGADHTTTLPTVDNREAQLYINRLTVTTHRSGGQDLSLVLRLSRSKRPAVAPPVRLSKLFRDDEIEVLADRLRGGVSEHPFSPGVPRAYRPGEIRENNCIRCLLEDQFRKVFRHPSPALLPPRSIRSR